VLKRRNSPRGAGFGRPPHDSQFKPGKSGNPKGRPKGSKNISTALQKELQTRIPITENGDRKTVTKEHAMIKQMVNRALGGDPKLIAVLLKALSAEEGKTDTSTAKEIFDSPDDKLVMADIVRRIRQMDPPAEDTPSAPAGPEAPLSPTSSTDEKENQT